MLSRTTLSVVVGVGLGEERRGATEEDGEDGDGDGDGLLEREGRMGGVAIWQSAAPRPDEDGCPAGRPLARSASRPSPAGVCPIDALVSDVAFHDRHSLSPPLHLHGLCLSMTLGGRLDRIVIHNRRIAESLFLADRIRRHASGSARFRLRCLLSNCTQQAQSFHRPFR